MRPSGAWAPAAVGAATFIVNRATQGMAARTRWALSPDSASLLVVEDPAGVENEAIPDGVMFATEHTGRTWRMDSVWSVAPIPSWSRLAVSRAVVLRNGESETIPASRFASASTALNSIAGTQAAFAPESLPAHAFPVSGMTYALGIAATFIVRTDVDTAEFPIIFARMGGWSTGWACASNGDDVLFTGDKPARVQDDDSAMVVTPSGTAERVAWVEGPVLDISVAIAKDSTKRFRVRDREVAQRADSIIVRDARGEWRAVGPGFPLASTRGGRFILAVAPRRAAKPHESPDQLVVYRVP